MVASPRSPESLIGVRSLCAQGTLSATARLRDCAARIAPGKPHGRDSMITSKRCHGSHTLFESVKPLMLVHRKWNLILSCPKTNDPVRRLSCQEVMLECMHGAHFLFRFPGCFTVLINSRKRKRKVLIRCMHISCFSSRTRT